MYQYNIWYMSFCVGVRPLCRSGISFSTYIPDGHLHRMTYTRCCIDTIDSPDDKHKVARNMYRIEINIYERNCASSWLFIRQIIYCCYIPHSSSACDKNGNTMRQCVSCLQTSRKPVIQLYWRPCTILTESDVTCK